MTIRHDVDLDKLNAFRTFLEENPDKARLTLEARGIYEGQVGRSTVHVGPYTLDGKRTDRATRHYTIPFGAWKEVEELIGVQGATDRMEPVETVLAATAACVVNSISFNTTRMGMNVEGIEVAIKTTVDPRVLFAVRGPEDHRSCLGALEYEVTVHGDVTDADLETIKKLCTHSPVFGMIAEPIPVNGTVARA